MYILIDYSNSMYLENTIEDEAYEALIPITQSLYRPYTVEDADMEEGHYFPGHELWED